MLNTRSWPALAARLLALTVVTVALALGAWGHVASAAEARVVLSCVASGANASKYAVQPKTFYWVDFSALDPNDARLWNGQGVPVRFIIPHGHVDATLKGQKSSDAVFEMLSSSRNYPLPGAYDISGSVKFPFMHSTSKYPNDNAYVTMAFSDIKAVADPGYDFSGWQMAFGDSELMSSGWTTHSATNEYEQTTITSDASLTNLGFVGTTKDSTLASNSYVTKQVFEEHEIQIAGGSSKTGYSDSKGALVAAAEQPTTFTVKFEHVKQGGYSSIGIGFNLPSLASASVSSRAVDEQGNALRTYDTDRQLLLNQTWDYSSHAVDGDIPGYDYVGLKSGSDPIKGTMTQQNWGPKSVTLVFRKHAYRKTAKAVDEDGNELKSIDGGSDISIGDSWAYAPPHIPGYTYSKLKDGSDPQSGTMSSSNLGNKNVVFVYAKADYVLAAKGVDESGRLLATFDSSKAIQLGSSWDYTSKQNGDAIPGYDYVGMGEGSDPAKGTLGTSNLGNKSVTLVYRLHEYHLTVRCVDWRGNTIKTVEDGKVVRLGDSWDYSEPPAVDGYSFVRLADGSDPLKGSVSDSELRDHTITLVYVQHASSLPLTGNGVPALTVLGGLAVGASAAALGYLRHRKPHGGDDR